VVGFTSLERWGPIRAVRKSACDEKAVYAQLDIAGSGSKYSLGITMERRNLWTTIGLVLVPLAFVSMIVVLWVLGFFEFSGTEASAKIVATALTLGGGLVASMITLIGLILRQSVEQRNADIREEAGERLRLEAERNQALQEEAERRLKLEAAIRAVDLLGTDAGGHSCVLQRTGALFTLSNLGMVNLAIDLVCIMRQDDLIAARPTASLLSRIE
jgi:hypothetical protein